MVHVTLEFTMDTAPLQEDGFCHQDCLRAPVGDRHMVGKQEFGQVPQIICTCFKCALPVLLAPIFPNTTLSLY